jgi:hypothetical protein
MDLIVFDPEYLDELEAMTEALDGPRGDIYGLSVRSLVVPFWTDQATPIAQKIIPRTTNVRSLSIYYGGDNSAALVMDASVLSFSSSLNMLSLNVDANMWDEHDAAFTSALVRTLRSFTSLSVLHFDVPWHGMTLVEAIREALPLEQIRAIEFPFYQGPQFVGFGSKLFQAFGDENRLESLRLRTWSVEAVEMAVAATASSAFKHLLISVDEYLDKVDGWPDQIAPARNVESLHLSFTGCSSVVVFSFFWSRSR